MKPSYSTSVIIGAITGLVVALALFLFVASLGAVSALNPAVATGSVEPVFSISASALWWMAIIIGLAGGAILASATRGVAVVIDPDSSPAQMFVIAPLGALIGAVIAMVVFPLGVTMLGMIAEGTATVTVTQMMILVVIAGVVGGGSIVWISYVLARPPVHTDDPDLLPA